MMLIGVDSAFLIEETGEYEERDKQRNSIETSSSEESSCG
jgi:hypothetical protein